MRMDKGKPFSEVEADFIPDGEDRAAPTFSEAFLYATVGKGDARFILGVADEYEHVIAAIGPAAVRAILDVKPRLVQRLGLPEKIVEWLEDARSSESLRREAEIPSQVIVDERAAGQVWEILHDLYVRTFDPENDIPKDTLRLYHQLTDDLGGWHQEQREKERARAEEKLERKRKREAALPARRERRVAAFDFQELAKKDDADPEQLLALARKALSDDDVREVVA